MNNTKKNKNYYEIIFVILLTVICFIWSVKMPYKYGSDEEMKMDICQYIYKHGKLPNGGDEAVRDETWGISYSFTPILDYMISAVCIKGISNFTTDSQAFLVAARFPTVLSYMGMLICTIKISKKLFKKENLRWLFLVFIACLPQLIFIGSYINNDCFALFCISAIIYSWLLGLETKWNTHSCILLGISIGLCALSYYNAYGYIISSIIIFILSIKNNKNNNYMKLSLKEIIKKVIIISLLAFAVSGWWFIRSAYLNHGDFLGLRTTDEYGEKYGVGKYKPSARITPYKQKQNIFQMLFWDFWIWQTVRSFIAVFGNMTVIFPLPYYLLYLLIYTLAIIGICLKKKDEYKKKKKILLGNGKEKTKPIELSNKIFEKGYIYKDLLMKIFILNIIIPILLSIYYSYYSDFQAQGRYIMPTIIPLMYFFTNGIYYLINKIIKSEKIKNIIIKTLTIVLVISGLSIVIYTIAKH